MVIVVVVRWRVGLGRKPFLTGPDHPTRETVPTVPRKLYHDDGRRRVGIRTDKQKSTAPAPFPIMYTPKKKGISVKNRNTGPPERVLFPKQPTNYYTHPNLLLLLLHCMSLLDLYNGQSSLLDALTSKTKQRQITNASLGGTRGAKLPKLTHSTRQTGFALELE